MTAPATQVQISPIENALVRGDLSQLSLDDRSEYYNSVCKSLGLNPLTRPFDYIVLNGRLTLYATRNAADQLRNKHGISLEIVSRTLENDILTVHVRAFNVQGRRDEDFGAVYMPASLKGEARANIELKAVTKAKRRATLSICGLGWLDETEVEDIPASARQAPLPPPVEHEGKRYTVVGPQTIKVEPVALPSSSAAYEVTAATLERASQQGYDALRKVWNSLDKAKKEAFEPELERLKGQARVVDTRKASV